MGQKQLLFIIIGVFLVGIALVTEYITTNNAPSWAAVNKGLPGTTDQTVVISDNNICVGTYKEDAWLRHIYEISPIEHNSFTAMVKQSSMYSW